MAQTNDLTLWRLLQLLPGVKPKVSASVIINAKPLQDGSYMLFGKHISKDQYDSLFRKCYSSSWMRDLYWPLGAGTDILLSMYLEGLLPMKNKADANGIDEFIDAANKIKAEEVYWKRYHTRLEQIRNHPDDIDIDDLKTYKELLFDEAKAKETVEGDDYHSVTRVRVGRYFLYKSISDVDSRNPRRACRELVSYYCSLIDKDECIYL